MTADNVLFEIKGLKKNFGDLEVLKGIHTTIRKGEVVVVIGPSGSGKSTFIRCLNLLETPTEGQIFFEGSCITDKGYAVHKHLPEKGKEGPGTGGRGKSQSAAAARRSGGQGGCLSRSAVRRTEAADRHCPGYGAGAGRDAL